MPTRIATPEDGPIVAALLAAFNDEFDSWAPQVEVLQDRFSRLLGTADFCVLLSMAPEPVGFALMTSRPSPYYDGPIIALDELYIAPDRRGQGLGAELMSHLVREAQSRAAGEIQINVDEDDRDTRRFYETHGFTNHSEGERMLCYLREL